MCWEMVDGKELSGLALDLSSGGLRLERPYTGGPSRKDVQLEIEVPGIDEVMWARGDVSFDILVPTTSPCGGRLGLIRRTGYRISRAAQRDLRRLHEVVIETHRARQPEPMLDQAFAALSKRYYARA